MVTETPKLQALKDCASWLRACLRLGWPKSSLDDLEALWWKYHDHEGNLVLAQAAHQAPGEKEGGSGS